MEMEGRAGGRGLFLKKTDEETGNDRRVPSRLFETIQVREQEGLNGILSGFTQ